MKGLAQRKGIKLQCRLPLLVIFQQLMMQYQEEMTATAGGGNHKVLKYLLHIRISLCKH